MEPFERADVMLPSRAVPLLLLPQVACQNPGGFGSAGGRDVSLFSTPWGPQKGLFVPQFLYAADPNGKNEANDTREWLRS